MASILPIAPQDTIRRIQRIQAITIIWMSVEAAVSLSAAWIARSPALLAFGGDSAIELLSAAVVLWRFRAHAVTGPGLLRGAGPGLMMNLGDSLHSTMDAGSMAAAIGAGRLGRMGRVLSTPRLWSPGLADRTGVGALASARVTVLLPGHAHFRPDHMDSAFFCT
jgi:hypothetical protein